MSKTELTVPEEITFESAIALTQDLLSKMENREIKEAEIEKIISDLVSTSNGARGFFVTYLTAESQLPDQPSEAVINALKTAPELVSELLVKNIAMSTAMAITHRRQNNESNAQGSDRVQQRSLSLCQKLNNNLIPEKAQQMRESALTGKGEAQVAFFERWGYDQEQRSAIAEILEDISKTVTN
ncbi:hypothetical protein FRE64_16120 [Euhalothece natronophila Z-M001]|uniref:Uncharacterized protein n=1 Tax=Euhalothece natronophila Z-M001 TaxID=522448 RepID=A0A5B8NS33_9CHRO|nr:hypothetical protein [Euhalothece natronophila]QDZ41331.1 hypothetical protein FRE64_16120 [Euhalothece natronophila Z-M001]